MSASYSSPKMFISLFHDYTGIAQQSPFLSIGPLVMKQKKKKKRKTSYSSQFQIQFPESHSIPSE
jgi:hypothetical protein